MSSPPLHFYVPQVVCLRNASRPFVRFLTSEASSPTGFHEISVPVNQHISSLPANGRLAGAEWQASAPSDIKISVSVHYFLLTNYQRLRKLSTEALEKCYGAVVELLRHSCNNATRPLEKTYVVAGKSRKAHFRGLTTPEKPPKTAINHTQNSCLSPQQPPCRQIIEPQRRACKVFYCCPLKVFCPMVRKENKDLF